VWWMREGRPGRRCNASHHESEGTHVDCHVRCVIIHAPVAAVCSNASACARAGEQHVRIILRKVSLWGGHTEALSYSKQAPYKHVPFRTRNRRWATTAVKSVQL